MKSKFKNMFIKMVKIAEMEKLTQIHVELPGTLSSQNNFEKKEQS